MSFTRRRELLLLVALWFVSLGALALVLSYSILPAVPHSERLKLAYYTDVMVQSSETYYLNMPNDHHPVSDANKGVQVRPRQPPEGARDGRIAHGVASLLTLCVCVQAPCWLSFVFFLPAVRNPGGTLGLTSYLDLPYGVSPPLNRTEAYARAIAFKNRHSDTVSIYIDESDQNNAFFNEDTGASIPDYSKMYDATADPPGLVIMVRRGEGVTVGGGFLLALCCAGLLLSGSALALRWWQDHHKTAGSAQQQLDASNSSSSVMARQQFSPLHDQDADEAEDAYRSTPTRSNNGGGGARPSSVHVLGDFDEEIELEERKGDAEDDSEPADKELPSPSLASSSSHSRPPVPRLSPPPVAAASPLAPPSDADVDLELASFEEEMMRQHHANIQGDSAQ